jgi:hypothetical protein
VTLRVGGSHVIHHRHNNETLKILNDLFSCNHSAQTF